MNPSLPFSSFMINQQSISDTFSFPSVSAEQISGIHLILHIVQAAVISVGSDGIALCLERLQMIDHTASEEGGAIRQGRFVHNDLGSLGLDAFHHALDGALTEIVAIGFHGQAIDSNHREF